MINVIFIIVMIIIFVYIFYNISNNNFIIQYKPKQQMINKPIQQITNDRENYTSKIKPNIITFPVYAWDSKKNDFIRSKQCPVSTDIDCDRDTIIPFGNGSCSSLSTISRCLNQHQVRAFSGQCVLAGQVCWNKCAKACVAPNSTDRATSQVDI